MHILVLAATTALAMGFVACGDDDDDTVPGGTGGTGAEGGGDTGGTGGGATGGSGNGGEGGGATTACDLSRTGRTEVVLSGTAEGALDASNVYVLEGNVYVEAGTTLTIPPCTRIEGDGPSLGTLIVTRGATIEAEGTADAPILFTSRDGATDPGSWGGVLILGSAPNSQGASVNVEGLTLDARHEFGGTDPDDNSGTFSYVRIEYSGIALTEGNEINGLTMGSVGSATTIDHVMIKDTLDDCFEWFGGTVNTDHLICVHAGDDMFDADDGYQGTMSYVFGVAGLQQSSDPQGIEWDGIADQSAGSTLDTVVTLQNGTVCGDEVNQYSMVLRRGIEGQIDELVAVGFPTGVDLRDDPSGISITNSTIVADALAADETAADNDGGVDDAAWFSDGAGNGTADPGFTAAQCLSATPADAVFDSDAGAFESDANWARGQWTGW